MLNYRKKNELKKQMWEELQSENWTKLSLQTNILTFNNPKPLPGIKICCMLSKVQMAWHDDEKKLAQENQYV